MVGRSLSALWKIALALMVLKCLADIARAGHGALALTAFILTIGIAILVGTRGSASRIAPVADPKADKGAAVLRQLSEPERVRIASLAASGNAIGAIQALRKLLNIDLRTAKDTIDQLAPRPDDEDGRPRVGPVRRPAQDRNAEPGLPTSGADSPSHDGSSR